MTVTELLERFVEHQSGRGRHPNTLANYRLDLGKAVALWGGDLECHSISYQHCLDYRQMHAHRPASSRSEKMILLRQWLAWGHQQGHLWKNPAQDLKEPCVRPKVSWVPGEDQVLSLLQAPNRDTAAGGRDATIIEILYGTGLRRRELYRLDLSSWQPDLAGLWVDDGKGGKPRLQPVGEHLAEVLQHYLEHARPLLVREAVSALLLDDHGQRFPYHRIGECLREYSFQAGLPDILPHALRRAFATHLLLRGAGLHEVQHLLGHSNPDVTQRYTKIGVNELAHEYRRTHPRAHARFSRRKRALVREHANSVRLSAPRAAPISLAARDDLGPGHPPAPETV